MRKLMIGCGAFIGLVLLIGLVSSWLLIRTIKHSVPMDRLEKTRKELVTRFGRLDDYVPPLDGRIPADRLGTYLRVREGLPRNAAGFVVSLDQLASQQKRMDEAKGLQKLKIGLKMAKGGMGVAKAAASYLTTRDSVLLAQEMGPGEYLFITTCAVVEDLQWDPPRCSHKADADSSKTLQLAEARAELATVFRKQLENARRKLQELEERDPAQEDWLAALTDALDHGPIGKSHIPFEEGLPEATAESLAPYRSRIEATLPPCREGWYLELLMLADENDQGFQLRLGNEKSTKRGMVQVD